MNDKAAQSPELKRAKLMMLIVIIGLFIAGVTIWPLTWELKVLVDIIWGNAEPTGELHQFIVTTIKSLETVAIEHPFILYGFDWLAYAHIVLAILFIGPYRDPVKNVWVIQFGLICCALVPVLAGICIPIRGMPFSWFLIDAAFAPAAALPLWIALKDVQKFTRTT